jgi:isopentenyl-diphosphate delta-isomerase
MESVILVDEYDREVGSSTKLLAHSDGKLHRAVSAFVFDCEGRLLLQQRARTKYHSGGLWSNTCCGHPRPGETAHQAITRRLAEEMGFICDLRPAFSFLYRAELDNELVEHEYDHVFSGRFDGTPRPDASEVEAWRWVGLDDLRREVRERTGEFTFWLKAMLERGLL